MGRNGFLSMFGHARLEHDDRFFPGDGLTDAGKTAAAVHALQIAHDHGRIRIIGQKLEHGRFVDDGPVAQTRESGKPDLLAGRPVQNRAAHGARRRKKSDVTPARQSGDKRGVHVPAPGRHAQAVGTQESHVPAGSEPRETLFQIIPPAADFPETGGDDDGGLHARVCQPFQCAGSLFRLQAENGQFRTGMRELAAIRGTGPIDGHNLPLIPPVLEIRQHGTRGGARISSSSDYGYGVRRKQSVQVDVSHGVP